MYGDEERERLYEQVRTNLKQAFAIVGGSEDELASMMVQISQVVAKEFRKKKGFKLRGRSCF